MMAWVDKFEGSEEWISLGKALNWMAFGVDAMGGVDDGDGRRVVHRHSRVVLGTNQRSAGACLGKRARTLF